MGVDLEDFSSDFERAVVSLTSWARIIVKQNPNIVFRIEDEHEKLKSFFIENNLIDQSFEKYCIDTKPVNSNKAYKGIYYHKPDINESDWLELSASTIEELAWYCSSFGYAFPGKNG